MDNFFNLPWKYRWCGNTGVSGSGIAGSHVKCMFRLCGPVARSVVPPAPVSQRAVALQPRHGVVLISQFWFVWW